MPIVVISDPHTIRKRSPPVFNLAHFSPPLLSSSSDFIHTHKTIITNSNVNKKPHPKPSLRPSRRFESISTRSPSLFQTFPAPRAKVHPILFWRPCFHPPGNTATSTPKSVHIPLPYTRLLLRLCGHCDPVRRKWFNHSATSATFPETGSYEKGDLIPYFVSTNILSHL